MNSQTPIEEILKTKRSTKEKLVKEYGFVGKNAPICMVSLADPETRDSVVAGLASIGVSVAVLATEDVDYSNHRNVIVVPHVRYSTISGFDFFVFDGEDSSFDVVKFLGAGVVPIMPSKNNFKTLLEAFNPMKFSGNAFFYPKSDMYNIFSKAVSYLENHKFPEDRKILLRNVCQSV